MTTTVVISVPFAVDYCAEVVTRHGKGEHDWVRHYVQPGNSQTIYIYEGFWIESIREVPAEMGGK